MWYLYGMAMTVVIKLINTITILVKRKSNKAAGEVIEFYDSADNKTLLTTLLPISLLSVVLWPITIILMPFAMKDILSSNDDE